MATYTCTTSSTNAVAKYTVSTSLASGGRSVTIKVDLILDVQWSTSFNYDAPGSNFYITIGSSTSKYSINKITTSGVTKSKSVTLSIPANGSLSYTVKVGGGISGTSFSITGGNSKTLSVTGSKATYSVSFNANGGSGAPSAQTKTYGTTLTLSSTKPTRAGYIFKGWGTSSTATTASYQPGSSYTSNAAITLYAIWQTAIYKVTLNNNGATSAGSADFYYIYGAAGYYSDSACASSMSKIAIPSKTGYTFKGYYEINASTISGSGTQFIASDGTIKYNTSVAANDTAYAFWEAKNYTLSVNPNNTGGTAFTQTLTYNTENWSLIGSYAAEYVAANPAYILLGFFTAPTGGTMIYDSTGKVVNDGTYWSNDKYIYTGNLTVYAQWISVVEANKIKFFRSDNTVKAREFVEGQTTDFKFKEGTVYSPIINEGVSGMKFKLGTKSLDVYEIKEW